MFSPDPDLDFFTLPGSRSQKGIGSGSATLAQKPRCFLTKSIIEDA
jgi:hypothetical protein